jgi:hypothetical protein
MNAKTPTIYTALLFARAANSQNYGIDRDKFAAAAPAATANTPLAAQSVGPTRVGR